MPPFVAGPGRNFPIDGVIIGPFFVILGVLVVYLMLSDMLFAGNWQMTPCEITGSKIEKALNSKGYTEYELKLCYVYKFNSEKEGGQF